MPSAEEFRSLLPAIIGVVVAGYFLGALPFGYLVARAHGVNIFQEGSKSPGATNVKRVVGRKAGNLVFALDVLKGGVAAGWPLLFGLGKGLGCAGLAAALLGHCYSIFTGFRGGKGIATGAGGFLVLMPIVTVIGAAVWIGLFFTTGYVSLASIAAAVTLPVAALILGRPAYLTLIAAVIAIFVAVRHRANIRRLIAGTENRRGRTPS